jgi:hypothetical protein
MGGQPGTLMMGLPEISLWMGVAPVGFGFALWMHPFEAQLPQQITAAAPLAASLTMSTA